MSEYLDSSVPRPVPFPKSPRGIVYKAIRNYVANELRIDREAILRSAGALIEKATISWLKEQIDSRWLKQILEKGIKDQIRTEVAEQVRKTLTYNLKIGFDTSVKP